MISRDVTAPVAFVLDVSLLVLLTVSHTVLIVGVLREKLALRALQLLEHSRTSYIKSLLLLLQGLYVLIISAGFETSKVGVFAGHAFEIIQVVNGKLFQVVVVFTLRICQTLIQVQTLMLGSQDALFLHLLFQSLCLIDYLLNIL